MIGPSHPSSLFFSSSQRRRTAHRLEAPPRAPKRSELSIEGTYTLKGVLLVLAKFSAYLCSSIAGLTRLDPFRYEGRAAQTPNRLSSPYLTSTRSSLVARLLESPPAILRLLLIPLNYSLRTKSTALHVLHDVKRGSEPRASAARIRWRHMFELPQASGRRDAYSQAVLREVQGSLVVSSEPNSGS